MLFLFQAYVPVGFMPAGGTPFLLELCPAAAPMPMSMPGTQHHHHHSDTTHDTFHRCPFGSVPAVGPLTHPITVASAAPVVSETVSAIASPRIRVRFDRAHPPRSPPPPA